MLSGVLVGFVLGVLAWWVAARLIYRSPRWRAEVARRWGVSPERGELSRIELNLPADVARLVISRTSGRGRFSPSARSLLEGLGRSAERGGTQAVITAEETVDLSYELLNGGEFADELPRSARNALAIELAEALTGRVVSLYVGHGRWIRYALEDRRVLYVLGCDCEETRPGLDAPGAAEATARAVGWEVTPHAVLCPTCRQIRDDNAAREVAP